MNHPHSSQVTTGEGPRFLESSSSSPRSGFWSMNKCRRRRFDWFVRDTVMNGPRALALGLALFLGLRVWGRDALGLHARGGRTAVFVFLTFFLILWLPDPWSRTQENGFGIPALLVLVASSVLVGFWEEILYRGVLLNAIRDWKGERAAIWGSSFLFTIMHVQAQPVVHWPSIFLSGVLFAVMRVQGVGLFWIIAVHAGFDALFLLGPIGPWRITRPGSGSTRSLRDSSSRPPNEPEPARFSSRETSIFPRRCPRSSPFVASSATPGECRDPAGERRFPSFFHSRESTRSGCREKSNRSRSAWSGSKALTTGRSSPT